MAALTMAAGKIIKDTAKASPKKREVPRHILANGLKTESMVRAPSHTPMAASTLAPGRIIRLVSRGRCTILMAPPTLANARTARDVVRVLMTTQMAPFTLAIGRMTTDMVKVSTHKLLQVWYKKASGIQTTILPTHVLFSDVRTSTRNLYLFILNFLLKF